MSNSTAATETIAPPRRPPPSTGRSRTQHIWHLSGVPAAIRISRLAFFTTALLFVAISVACFAIAVSWIDRPFPGFLLNERMVPGNVGRYEWTGTQAGLRYPDKILAANGRPVKSMKDLDAVVDEVGVGAPITYLVDRGGQLVTVTVGTMRFTVGDLILTFGITFASGLLYLSLGVIVFLLKPDTRVSWAYLALSACLGLYSITAFDIQSTHKGFIRLYLFVLTLLPAAVVHLSLLFPERLSLVERHPRVQAIPYVASAVLIGPMQALYPDPRFMIPYRAAFGYLIVAALAIAASSLLAYVKRASILARQRAKIVLLGAALAFPVPAAAHYLSLFAGAPIQINFLAIPIVLFPASIAYAVARHNLFDVDLYIKRAVGYGVMTAIVAATYVSMQAVLSTFVLQPLFGRGAESAYPLVFALLVVFLFNPVQHRVQAAVDRIFFRSRFDYKSTVSTVSDALTSLLRLDQIVQQVVHTIRKEMFVEAAGVVLASQRTGTMGFLISDSVPRADAVIKTVAIPQDDCLLELLREERTLLTRYDLDEDPRYAAVRENCLSRLADLGASIAIPLIYQSQVTGALVLGEKKSGQFYSRDDIDLLTTMGNQAAVAIQNAATHEEVVRYAEELAASLRRIQLLESIKSNLAKFVPTTVQQLIEESPEAPLLDKREVDVSVLFADITGYTRLSAQMELDEVNRLVERYFGAFLDEIIRFGGDVNETAGDGLMVIFQNPDPRRHARAAVLTALGIRRRAEEINHELGRQSDPIVMHIAVNSGIAGVGATRIEGAAGTRWTYTASGTTTNVAARLAALSEGGAVVISEGTRSRIGDEFGLEDLGPQPLKNVPTPIRAYLVVSEPPRFEEKVGDERRRYPRHPVQWRIRLSIGDMTLEGRALDASTYGVCLAQIPDHSVTPQQACLLEIFHDSDPIICEGVVRYVNNRGIGIETKDVVLPD